MTPNTLPYFPRGRKTIEAPALPAKFLDPTWLFARIAAGLISEPAGADERFFGTDLPALSLSALRLELARLRHSTLFADRPSPWATERLGRIERELMARPARSSRVATGGVR